MNFLKICLILMSFSLTPVFGTIVLPNYNSNPIGERAGLQGGAFLVRANDASATWYNPAGLVRAQRNSISGNASAFAYQQGKKSDDDEGSTFVPIPNLIGGVGKMYPNLAWGFSVATPNSLRLSNEIRETRTSSSISAEDYSYSERNNGLFSLTTPGIAIATSFSENLRVGFGVRYYMFEIRNLRNITHFNQHSSATDTGLFVSDVFDLNLASNSIRLNMGLQYDISENLSFGLMVRSSNFQVSSNGEQYQVNVLQKSHNDTEIITIQDEKDLEVNFELPYELGVGISYTGKKWEFEVDVRYYTAVEETNMLDFELNQSGISTRSDPFNNIENAFDATVRYEFESVINYAIGVGRKVGKTSIVQAGYFVDNSPVAEEDGSIPFTHIDLTGYTFGFTNYTKNSSTSYGLLYVSGEQDNVRSDNRATDQTDRVTASMSILGLMISGSYYF